MYAEVKKNTRTELMLKGINILAWIIYIGLCIKTGAILYSFFVSLFINPEGAKDLHDGLNLSALYAFSQYQYSIIVSLMVLLAGLKAYVFHLVIRIFLKFNLVQPFSIAVSLLISRISYVALGIGILSVMGKVYSDRLVIKGVAFPDLQNYLGGGAEFLFFAGVIFFIAQVFKRGLEIQSEHELTV